MTSIEEDSTIKKRYDVSATVSWGEGIHRQTQNVIVSVFGTTKENAERFGLDILKGWYKPDPYITDVKTTYTGIAA